MPTAIVIGILLGWIAFYVTRDFDGKQWGYKKTFRRMGLAGFAIGVIAVIVLGQLAGNVGERWAKDNQLTYNEFLNGYETEAVQTIQQCGRDSGCKHTYNCDPYEVADYHSATYDSKGNMTSPAYTTYHTEYHHCPYVYSEWTFFIRTSLKKDFVILDSGFPDQPKEYREGNGIPGDVFRGTPPFWAEAKKRIESGNPGPVTVAGTYKNYILAAQNSILKQYSGSIDSFKSQNLLPQISTATANSGITSPYLGTKAYFVTHLPNEADWRAAVNKFDSALGTDLQGDLHVVFVDKNIDKDAYKGALNAYWTGPELEKNDLSKNGIVVIVGVDGNKEAWMKAFTGMPGGNEGMLTEIESLKNVDLSNPSVLLGSPSGIINADKKVKEITHSKGLIENIVWGPNKFTRVCMTCDGSGQGYTYLDADIELTSGQNTAILFVSVLLFMFVWGVIAFVQIPDPEFLKDWTKRATNR